MNPGFISDAKLAANRANAQLSTGPKTEQGKAASSKNRVKHGLTGRFDLTEFESREDFEELRSRLHSEHQPATETERMLVDNMAQHHWLIARALFEQHACLGLCNEGADKRFALMLRYQTTNERAFHRCLNQLLKLQKERKNEEVGFVSQHAKLRTAMNNAEASEIKVKLLQTKLGRSRNQTEPSRARQEAVMPEISAQNSSPRHDRSERNRDREGAVVSAAA